MTQEIIHNAGQVTKDGNIIVCQGGSVCPLARRDEPASKLHADFAARTGIWCPVGAQEVFERLIADHGFTAPQLRAAWQTNSLVWSSDEDRLVIKTHWIESVSGYAFVVLMILYLLLQGGQAVVSDTASVWQRLAALGLSVLMYGSALWLVLRFVILPFNVASRVRRSLRPKGNGIAKPGSPSRA